MDAFPVSVDLLPRRTESEMQMGGAYPESLVSVLRTRPAPLSRPGKSLVLAGVPGNLGPPFSGQPNATTFWSPWWHPGSWRPGRFGYGCVLRGRNRLLGMGCAP